MQVFVKALKGRMKEVIINTKKAEKQGRYFVKHRLFKC